MFAWEIGGWSFSGHQSLARSGDRNYKPPASTTQPPTQIPTKEEAWKLFMDRVLPPSLSGLKPETTERLLQMVDEWWGDIDDCYEFDWDRSARPAERPYAPDQYLVLDDDQLDQLRPAQYLKGGMMMYPRE